MRCQNTEIYATYFAFIDDCIMYYSEYQLALRAKYIMELCSIITEKDTTIAEKEDSITALRRELAQYAASNQQQLAVMHQQLAESQQQTATMQQQIADGQKQVADGQRQIIDGQNKLTQHEELNRLEISSLMATLTLTNNMMSQLTSAFTMALVDRALRPKNFGLICQFVLMSTDSEDGNRVYYAIRRQQRSITQAICSAMDTYPRIIIRVPVPNSIYCYNNIKAHETLTGLMKFIDPNTFRLSNIRENDFINQIFAIIAEKDTKGLPKFLKPDTTKKCI